MSKFGKKFNYPLCPVCNKRVNPKKSKWEDELTGEIVHNQCNTALNNINNLD